MQQQVQVSRVFPDGDCEVFVRRESACSGDCHKCSGCGAQAVRNESSTLHSELPMAPQSERT